MNKVLQATSRGQVTLPKAWRDQFDTNYYVAAIQGGVVTITPLIQADFKNQVENSWKQYKSGDFVSQKDLMKKYGL